MYVNGNFNNFYNEYNEGLRILIINVSLTPTDYPHVTGTKAKHSTEESENVSYKDGAGPSRRSNDSDVCICGNSDCVAPGDNRSHESSGYEPSGSESTSSTNGKGKKKTVIPSVRLATSSREEKPQKDIKRYCDAQAIFEGESINCINLSKSYNYRRNAGLEDNPSGVDRANMSGKPDTVVGDTCMKSSTEDSEDSQESSREKNNEDEDVNRSYDRDNGECAGKTSGMIDSRDLTEQELEILRGDTVGESAHSSVWILKTLMSLCKVNEFTCTEEVEKNIGHLFDASIDQDVRSFLMQHDFLRIAEYILLTCAKPDIFGIVLSIISNLCSDVKVIDLIGSNENFVILILNNLKHKDTRILNEVLKFLKIVMYRIWWNAESDWIPCLKKCSYFRESIINILQNSTNDDLLMETIAVLRSIFSMKSLAHASFLTQLFQIDDLIPVLRESFVEVIPEEHSIYYYNTTQMKFIKNWMDIVDNIDMQILLKCNNEDLSELIKIMCRILESYNVSQVSAIPSEDVPLILLIVNMIYNFHVSNVNVSLRMNYVLASLAFDLEQASSSMNEEEQDPNMKKTTNELSNSMKDYWLKIINLRTVEQIIEIFRPFDQDILKYLKGLITHNSDTTSEMFVKIASIVYGLCQES